MKRLELGFATVRLAEFQQQLPQAVSSVGILRLQVRGFPQISHGLLIRSQLLEHRAEIEQRVSVARVDLGGAT